MIASTQYNDLMGTAAADITDHGTSHNSLEDLAKKFNLDESKLKLVGLTFYGIDDIKVNLICIDLERSKLGEKYMITLALPDKVNGSLPRFFKRLDVTLFGKFDKESPLLEAHEGKKWSDYMVGDEEE